MDQNEINENKIHSTQQRFIAENNKPLAESNEDINRSVIGGNRIVAFIFIVAVIIVAMFVIKGISLL